MPTLDEIAKTVPFYMSPKNLARIPLVEELITANPRIKNVQIGAEIYRRGRNDYNISYVAAYIRAKLGINHRKSEVSIRYKEALASQALHSTPLPGDPLTDALKTVKQIALAQGIQSFEITWDGTTYAICIRRKVEV